MTIYCLIESKSSVYQQGQEKINVESDQSTSSQSIKCHNATIFFHMMATWRNQQRTEVKSIGGVDWLT